MECDITFEKPVLKDMEEIARLLSSPAFYDENTHQLNFAAFNLRRFTNGEVESYVFRFWHRIASLWQWTS